MFPSETGRDTGIQEVKKKDIVDQRELTASPTLRRKGKTEMSKLVKAINSLCSTYDTDFRKLVEGNDFGIAEELTRKENFVPPDPPCNLQTDWSDGHAACVVVGLNGMKTMGTVLEDAVKLETHRHPPCSALQFAQLHKGLTVEKKKTLESTKKGHSENGYERKGSESVVLRPAFEIEYSALHDISAVGNNRQTTTAKRAAHTSVLMMVMKSWWSWALKGKLLEHANNGGHGKLVTNHPWLTNAVKNILRVASENRLFSGSTDVLENKGAANAKAGVCRMDDRP